MTTKDTSGGAFPFSPNDQSTAHMATNGMSLRDWFAGQAIMGLHTQPDTYGMSPTYLAEMAYATADAMLVARQEDPPHDA